MKVYLLELKIYEGEEEKEEKIEPYSSLERAVEEGKYYLEKEAVKEEDDYQFDVTEIDIAYAEKFDLK